MALLHLHRHHIRIWHDTPKAIRCVAVGVAAFCALPTGAMAQTTSALSPDLPANCVIPMTDRPVQMALTSLHRVEPGAGPLVGTKATAILGGVPSKLEQMRMVQAADGAPTDAIASVDPAKTGDLPIAQCNDANPTTVAQNTFSPAFTLPENAVLGTMSVAIKHTPFDRDWAMVNSRQNSRKMQRALAATGARRSGDQAAQVEAVNRWVNRKIEFGEDRDIYGRADYWAPAAETFRRGVGDCEDFAIAKMELLSALGIGRDKMRLVVARDLVRNADHAVLVVTMADGAVMLDNMTDRLLDARQPNDYRPIMSFSQNAKWIHGYAVQSTQPVRMASINPVPQPAPSKVADVLTVTAEPEGPVLSLALLSVPLVLPTLL